MLRVSPKKILLLSSRQNHNKQMTSTFSYNPNEDWNQNLQKGEKRKKKNLSENFNIPIMKVAIAIFIVAALCGGALTKKHKQSKWPCSIFIWRRPKLNRIKHQLNTSAFTGPLDKMYLDNFVLLENRTLQKWRTFKTIIKQWYVARAVYHWNK